MQVIQFQPSTSIEARIVELPTPEAQGHDILVQVEAIGLNPVDTKVRPGVNGDSAVLGYDAAGIVITVGEKVTLFKKGDAVFYSGDITRPGTNSELHLVDERVAALRPKSLDAASSAALPLTSITAYEALFDRLKIDIDGANSGQTLLIIGGAGGVGSIGIQLAKLAGLTVIATASRLESSQWCVDLGADYVVNHREPLQPQLKELGFETVDYIANYNNTDEYWDAMGEVIAPQGGIVLIVEPSGPVTLGDPLKRKSASIAWEFMFTRSMFETQDMVKQNELLTKIAQLVDEGKIKTTIHQTLQPINVDNLQEAHRIIELGQSIGKLVIKGWD